VIFLYRHVFRVRIDGLFGGGFTRKRRKGCEGTDEAGDLDVTYGRVRRVTALGPGITAKNKTVVLYSMYVLY